MPGRTEMFSVTLRFNGHFSRWIWFSQFHLKLRMMEAVSSDNWIYRTCKAHVKSLPSKNQHPMFHRPDALLVAEWLGRWTCDQQVAGSNPGFPTVACNSGQVVDIHVPLSPSSIIWYQPTGGDALRLGR